MSFPFEQLPPETAARIRRTRQPDWLAPMLATLTDRRFSDPVWLYERKGRTQAAVLIDLFRELGVSRNWAIGFVDPFTGKLRHLSFCTAPCDG